MVLSDQDETESWRVLPLNLDELARRKHAETVADLAELAADIWESDEDLDAFLAHFGELRDSPLG